MSERKEKPNAVTLDAKILGEIIGGLYYGVDEDLSQTEDLLAYLEKHPELRVTVSV